MSWSTVRVLPVTIVLALCAATPVTGDEPVAAEIAGTAEAVAVATLDRVRTFVGRYEAAVNRRDAEAIRACIDGEALIDRAQHGIELTEEFRRGFREGALQGFDWGASLVAGLGQGGHYKLLRVERVNGEFHALLRLVSDQGGVNYHDVEIAPVAAGGFRIVDVYVYLSGERLSDTVRRSLEQFVAAMQEGDKAYVEAYSKIGAMAQLMQSGHFQEAMDLYALMPESLQREKMVMILRVQCATQMSDEVIDAACTEFRAAYPDDACVDLLTLDQQIVRGQWDQARATLMRIKAAVGPDGYLDDLIANVFLQEGRLEDARAAAMQAIEVAP
ncbi:MAG: hypothetical protein KJO43_10370, partial [Phycisphaerae bacterium]|nr:hypothetical protein [Phycisphaerae bacterium]